MLNVQQFGKVRLVKLCRLVQMQTRRCAVPTKPHLYTCVQCTFPWMQYMLWSEVGRCMSGELDANRICLARDLGRGVCRSPFTPPATSKVPRLQDSRDSHGYTRRSAYGLSSACDYTGTSTRRTQRHARPSLHRDPRPKPIFTWLAPWTLLTRLHLPRAP
jgi:hypothetical protein